MAQQATPLSLNNGMYLQTKKMDHQMHLDSAHLKYLNQGEFKDATDLGTIQPFINSGYLIKPGMYELANFGANRIMTDGHIYKWSTPIPEEDFYVLEDMSGTDKAGVDEQSFKIKMNRRKVGNTAILKADKFSDIEIYVTADEIIQDGDGWVYTVRLNSTNKKNKYVPKEYLRPGVRWFQTGSVMGEYSQTYNDMTFSGGVREFYNYVGEGTANVHFTVTRDAAVSKISRECVQSLDAYREVIEMYQFKPGSKAYDISLQHRVNPAMGMMKIQEAYRGDQKAIQKDVVAYAWVPKVEALGMAMIETDVNNYAMWGTGGTLEVEGKSKVRLPIGLFQQLNKGNKYFYNPMKLTLAKFEIMMLNLLKDRIEPYQGNVIEIKTGQAGLRLVKSLISQLPSSSGMQIWGNDFIQGINKGNGTNFDLHYATPEFTSYDFTFGRVKFSLAESLDPVEASEVENPMVKGFRLSSYMFIVSDITGGTDNIYELTYGPDWDVSWRFINGRMNYLGMPTGKAPFASSNNGPGFEVYMEKRMKAFWVKDPTKALILKPINPFTGKPFAEASFGF